MRESIKIVVIVFLGLFVLIASKCNKTSCEEEDYVCRSKYYVSLIQKGKYEELKSSYAFPPHTSNHDYNLKKANNFINSNKDSLILMYEVTGNNPNSDFVEVNVRVGNEAYKKSRNTDFITLLYINRSVIGKPLASCDIITIPYIDKNRDKKLLEIKGKLKNSIEKQDSMMINFYLTFLKNNYPEERINIDSL